MEIIKLDGNFTIDQIEYHLFQIVQSEIDDIKVGSFILDKSEMETKPQAIIDRIYELESEGYQLHYINFIYTPQEINESNCSTTKFLKQLKREMALDVIF